MPNVNSLIRSQPCFPGDNLEFVPRTHLCRDGHLFRDCCVRAACRYLPRQNCDNVSRWACQNLQTRQEKSSCWSIHPANKTRPEKQLLHKYQRTMPFWVLLVGMSHTQRPRGKVVVVATLATPWHPVVKINMRQIASMVHTFSTWITSSLWVVHVCFLSRRPHNELFLTISLSQCWGLIDLLLLTQLHMRTSSKRGTSPCDKSS